MDENKDLWYVGPIFPLPIIYCNGKKIATMSKDLPIELREEYARLIVDAVNAASSTQKNEFVIPDVMPTVCPKCGSNKVAQFNGKEWVCEWCDFMWHTEA